MVKVENQIPLQELFPSQAISFIGNRRLYGGYKPDNIHKEKFLNLLLKCGHEPDGHKIATIFDKDQKDIILAYYLTQAFPNWKAGMQAIGDCMSWSCSHTVDVLMGVQAYLQQSAETTPYQVCSETEYGFMRVEIYGKPDPGGDGASGSGAAEAVMKFGTLHRTKYNLGKGWDFTTYDSTGKTAKQFGYTGVPDELEPIAREHIVKTATLVTNFDDAAKFIMNGYPISNAHMSNPTCEGTRDKDGYGKGTGYPHAMNYIGVRWTPKPALLKTNTGWNGTVSGPMWPTDLNTSLVSCAWWEEASICDKVLKGEDSYAYSQYQGFKKQDLPDYGTSQFL